MNGKPGAGEPLAPVTLVLGGARSGKSRFAEGLVASGARRPVYVATASAGDAEMAARIAAHRARRGAEWVTVEEPLRLADALAALDADAAALVDCLTLWLANLMEAGLDVDAERCALIVALRRLPAPAVLVSSEVGQGIVPDNAAARRFRDAAGLLHQDIAAVADRVYFVVAGLPQRLK